MKVMEDANPALYKFGMKVMEDATDRYQERSDFSCQTKIKGGSKYG